MGKQAEKLAEAERRVEQLKAQLQGGEADKKLAVSEAVREKEKELSEQAAEMAELKNRLARQETESQLKAQSMQREYESRLKQKDEMIEYYKDFKARQSTKMIGESLEQHCLSQFNALRMTAFPDAYFEKDNDARSGSKGDFIFRESRGGVEFISIMFEMKNEADETATKHKNEDFFRELDKDRREKKCEYAVLVSLLEADSELYNNGIVDVSYKYEKMYVIRPQFFIPIITLLRNAALGSLKYRQELEVARNQQIDILHFEENMNAFKEGFGRNYRLASEKFRLAIEEIDKTIDAPAKDEGGAALLGEQPAPGQQQGRGPEHQAADEERAERAGDVRRGKKRKPRRVSGGAGMGTLSGVPLFCFGFFHHPERGAHAPAAFGGVVHGEGAAVALRERAANVEAEAKVFAVAGGGLVAEVGFGGALECLGREAGAVVLHGEDEGVAEAAEGGGDARFRVAGGVGGEVVKHAEDERRVRAGRAAVFARHGKGKAAADDFALPRHLRAQGGDVRFRGNDGDFFQPRRLAHGGGVALEAGYVAVHHREGIQHLFPRQAAGGVFLQKVAVPAQNGQRRAQVVGKGGLHLPPLFERAPEVAAGGGERGAHLFHGGRAPCPSRCPFPARGW